LGDGAHLARAGSGSEDVDPGKADSCITETLHGDLGRFVGWERADDGLHGAPPFLAPRSSRKGGATSRVAPSLLGRASRLHRSQKRVLSRVRGSLSGDTYVPPPGHVCREAPPVHGLSRASE